MAYFLTRYAQIQVEIHIGYIISKTSGPKLQSCKVQSILFVVVIVVVVVIIFLLGGGTV